MTLEQATQIQLEGPRPARREDLADLLETANLIMRTSRGRAPSIASDFPHIYNPEHVSNIMIMRDGARVVASTGIWINQIDVGGASLKVGGINVVVTLPEYRKHGLGTKVMQACHRRMAEMGCHVGLLGTNIVNWYRKLGWERAGIQCRYQINRSNIDLLPSLPGALPGTGGVELRHIAPAAEADDATLAALLALYHESRLGGRRDVPLLRQLLTARGSKLSYVIAQRGNEPIAYLLTSGDSINEWAGRDAPTIAGLVRAWYEASDDQSLSTSQRNDGFAAVLQDARSIAAPPAWHPFADLLRRLGLPCSAGCQGMLYVLDAPAIVKALGREDVTVSSADPADAEATFTVHCGQQSAQLDRRRLTQLLFGPERPAGLDLPPFPFWQWGLEHV